MATLVKDEFAARRRTQAAETLSVEASRWLDKLSPNVRPPRLPVEYARIANAISRQWGTPAACLAYFDDLLIDKRGNRHGFPMGIVLELAALKDYFQTFVQPAPRTVWDEVLKRSRAGQK